MRTIKEGLVWLNKFKSLKEIRERIGEWMENDYNRKYVHRIVGYLSTE